MGRSSSVSEIMSAAFFWVIGVYNVVGGLAFAACVSERVSDVLLGKTLQIVKQPYTHGEHGPLWVVAASGGTVFLGLVNVAAVRWPASARAEVALFDAITYGAALFGVFAALKSPRYVRAGLYACVVLWLAQIAWALAAWAELSR
jgi:hypothetical protein